MLVRMESGDWISTRPSLVLFSWAAKNMDTNARLQYRVVLIKTNYTQNKDKHQKVPRKWQ